MTQPAGHYEGAYKLENGLSITLFMEPVDGRYVATEVWVHAEGGVTSEHLRSIPLARLEALGSAGRGYLQRKRSEHAAQSEPDLAEKRAMLRYAKKAPPKPPARKPLGRPDGSDPTTFYTAVADAYRSAVAETNKPSVLLAEENGVPVGTVRRWVLEARRRGVLEPTTQGSA